MSESLQVLPGASVRGQLLSRRLRNVRHRLRWEKALRGMAWTVGGFLLLSLVTTWLASVANFSSQRVQIFAWSLALGTGAIFFWSLLRPQFQKLDDGKLARFVEEKNPHIQDRLVTAVEVSGKKGSFPEPLLRRLVEDAWSRTAAVTNRQLFEVRETLISTVALALAVLLLAVGLLWGPAFLTHGFQQFWSAWSAADLPSPLYQIEIRPGNVTVARNSDQEVLARPLGFQPSGVRLFARSGKGESWEEFPMEAIPRQQGFRFLLFDLRAPVRYYAEADGIRSREFLIDISELPKVRRIQLTYHFPSYTGLPPRVEEDGGDIRALAGTRVLARILTDVPLTQGSLQLEDGSRIPLEPVPGENQLAGELVVRSDSLYHVRLVDSSGKDVKASDDYLIVALDDQPPAVRISRPGRDEQVTSVEEVLAEAEAQDDFGLAELRLHYSVNGAPEQGKLLAKNPGREARGHHIFYLEEFGLVPGDLVTYYASARDGRSSAQTDVYFLEIRAFEKEFYQGQTRPAGGQMGSQADDLFLSERQKEIIAATWNLIRRQAEIEPASFAQNAQAVATAQRKLRERLETLIARLQSSHLVGAGAEVRTLLEEMEQASKAMEAARGELSARRLRDAMIPEQKALQHLLRAEASFRKIQVNFGNQGMAGGESSRSWAKDLQDLFELELDREKNQYETLPQASQRGEEMDEAMQRLKELARRQEQLLDQQRNARGQPPATSRWEQETLRRETEELARRLERMAGRQGQGEPSTLEDIRRRLERAARDMEAANRPGSGSSQEATRALERLREAQSALSRQREQRHQGQIEDLANRAEELVQDQKRIGDQVRKTAEATPQALRGTLGEKRELLEELTSLERDIHETARRFSSEEAEAARQLKSAGNWIQNERIADQIRVGFELLRQGLTELAREREEAIQQDLEQLRNQIAQAQEKMGTSQQAGDQRERALNRAGRLVEDLEAMRQRLSQQQAQRLGPNRDPSTAGSPRAGDPSARVAPGGPFPRPPSPEELRALDREYRDRIGQAAEIQDILRGDPEFSRQVRDLIRTMKELDSRRIPGDPEELARLRSQVIDGFRQLELDLRRALSEGQNRGFRLPQGEQIPPQYRKQVEEYYRALSRSTGSSGKEFRREQRATPVP